MSVVRMWRMLHMLKRGGRAHDDSGVLGTLEGELAVECPACPHPGKNLPFGWENAPTGERFVINICLDIHL